MNQSFSLRMFFAFSLALLLNAALGLNPVAAQTPGESAAEAAQAANRFVVTVVKRDERHPWYGKGLKGRGNEMVFAVDGVSGKELILVRGQTYIFEIHSTPQHDFYITTSDIGRGTGLVSEGVEGNFTYEGTVTFTPTAATPDVVYYQCQNHTYMGGAIYIVNHPGEEPKRPAADTSKVVKEVDVDPEKLKRSVQQKLMFANMALRGAGAKRVAASDNEEAKGLLHKAEQMIADAKSTLSDGDAAKAKDLVDEALRVANDSFKLVPDERELKQQAKIRYEELWKSTHSLFTNYQKTHARSAQKGEPTDTGVDPKHIEQDMAQAEKLAQAEDYAAANAILEKTEKALLAGTTELLGTGVITYDTNFATPEEEYQYEQHRNKEFAGLVDAAIEQIKPPKMKMSLVARLKEQAITLAAEAEKQASAGDHANAIKTMQKATGKYQGALQMMGVR